MNKYNIKYISSPFDWIYSEKITDIIQLIDNKFYGFTNIDNYNIQLIKENTFFGLNNALELNKRSNFMMKHKYYKIRLPHELEILDDILKFQIKYDKLIDEFYKYDNLTFIRLGKKDDINFLDQLIIVLKKYFANFKIIFVDISKYQTSNWQKNELSWDKIFNL
jgi:hypothetical protein